MPKFLSTMLLALGGLVVTAYLLALVVPLDPEERRPGLRLSGPLTDSADPDFSFLAPRQLVYVQTTPWYGIPHSVTTTSFVLQGDLYIPCARCPSKRWPRNVAHNPDVVVKAGETLYPMTATRVTDRETLHRLFAGAEADPHSMPDVWVFKMTPR